LEGRAVYKTLPFTLLKERFINVFSNPFNMKLFIVRHGETVENKTHIHQGHLPGRLTKEGKEQAEKIAFRLKKEKFDYVYSSDLARASDTAKIIMKYHKGQHIIYSQELREINQGTATGKKHGTVDWKNDFPKGAETFVQLRKRLKKFFYKFHKKHVDDKVLIVAHGGSIRALIMVLFKKPFMYEKKVGLGKMPNTSLTILEIDENKNYKIKIFNCGKHLK